MPGSLGVFAVVAAGSVGATHGRAAPLAPECATTAGALRGVLADPLLAVLGAGVAAALTYALALTLLTPQNDFDTIYDHLWRAGLWFQGAALGYPDCACAPYINAYPPLGEIGTTLTMVLGQSDRYVGLPQAAAYGALVLGVVGIARRIGLGPAEALFGGLLVATLPVLALQASTAQNDLVVASFVVAAVVFLLEEANTTWRRWSWSLTAIATALALGTKVSAPFAIPLLLAVAVLVPRGASARTRLVRCGAVVLGIACGSFWYWVNRAQLGSFDGGFPPDTSVGHGLAEMAARIDRMAILFVDAPGASGRDVLIFPLVALVIAVVIAVRGRSHPRRALPVAGIVVAIGLAPMLLSTLATQLERVHVKVVDARRSRRSRVRRHRPFDHALRIEHVVVRAAWLVAAARSHRCRRGRGSEASSRSNRPALCARAGVLARRVRRAARISDRRGAVLHGADGARGGDVGHRGAVSRRRLGRDRGRAGGGRARAPERRQASLRPAAARAK